MTLTLLRSKLHRPRPARTIVQRPALVQRIDEGLGGDLTLVVGPVGYGKTTLVAAWADQAAQPVAWLSLSENDNDLSVFLTYLIAAIQTIFPEACPDTRGLLPQVHAPEPAQLAPLLVNEIDDLSDRFVLVLDDYHCIRSRAIHQLLDCLLTHPPLQMHLLIASRSDPPLAVARMRANGRLNELRIGDLRFTQLEAEQFLAQTTSAEQFERAANMVVKRSEGWIAGLQLAALSLHRASSQAAMLQYLERGIDRYIMDYLFEQVLDQQAPEVQVYLLRTSILERISPALAQTLVDDTGGRLQPQVSLAELERSGIFVSTLDGNGEWYGYHSLFRELLHHHLEARHTKEEIAELHCRASVWFRQQGLIDEALHHALAAGDLDLAAQTIIDHFGSWLDREEWPAVERWLNLLPAAAFEAHPLLLVARANLVQIQSDYRAVLPLLAEAEKRLADAHSTVRSGGEAVLRGHLELLWAVHWLFANQPQRAITSVQRALDCLPPDHRYIRGSAQIILTMALQVSGDAITAEKILQDELARIPRLAAGAYFRLRLLLCLMSVRLAEGNLELGEEIANSLLQEAIAFNAPISQLWAHLALGVIAYEANDLPRAAYHYAQGAALRHVGHVRGGHECLIGLAESYQAIGRVKEARGVADVLADYHRPLANPTLTAEGKSLHLRLAILNGNYAGNGHPPDDRGAALSAIIFGWKEIPALTRILAMLTESSPAALAEARHAIDELLEVATNLHKPAHMAELLALKARLHEQRKERSEALQALRKAVAVGEPRGLVRSIADAGLHLEPLVLSLLRTAPSPYLQRVLVALRPPASAAGVGQASAPQTSVPVHLTRREREVLALLTAYKTDREIADQLVMSPLTVRTHIEHLAKKLSVNGRRAIVARAVEMNLLA